MVWRLVARPSNHSCHRRLPLALLRRSWEGNGLDLSLPLCFTTCSGPCSGSLPRHRRLSPIRTPLPTFEHAESKPTIAPDWLCAERRHLRKANIQNLDRGVSGTISFSPTAVNQTSFGGCAST